jgi:hypothetical protein
MKKIILVFALVFADYQLKAQSLFPSIRPDSLSNNLFNKSLNGKPKAGLYDKYLKTKPDTAFGSLDFGNHVPISSSNYDNMPIVALNIYDRMPIAKLGGHYTMPVKKITEFDELSIGKRLFPLLR